MKKIAPHTLFFLLLSILYGFPLLLTLFFDLNADMPYVSEEILSEFKKTRWAVLGIYVIAISSFLLGTSLMNSLVARKIGKNTFSTCIGDRLNEYQTLAYGQKVFIYFLIFFGCLLLLQMYKAGTFSANYMESFEYAFAAQNMFAIFCDLFLFLYVYLWYNYKGKYKVIKAALLLLIVMTLLKGSRMFVVPVFFFIFYKNIYVQKLSRRKMVWLLCITALVLAGLFSMFFLRHNSSLESDNVASLLLLLVQYESCGVHIPLMKEILLEWHTSFAPVFTLFTDVLLFLVPRFIFPAKNDYLYFDTLMEEYNLSPFGGTNGEASIILYFGIFYPFAFLALGFLFSYLCALCKILKYKWLTPLYIYLCCSLIFTFLRNGVLIAFKNFILIVFIIWMLYIAKRLVINLKK